MLHLIHNPVAGRGRSRDAARRVVERLDASGVESRVWTTERPGHATRLTEALPGDATVVAIGGDGTLHEVARTCVGTDRIVGVVPVGSGDDFAYALGLPRGRIEPAVAALLGGSIRTVDTGVCNGEPFFNAMGAGFDAEVGALVNQAPAGLSGLTGYLWAVFIALRNLSPAHARIEMDGRLVHDGPCLLASCLNGPRTGGSFLFAPAARLDDGLLELVYAGPLTRAGTVALLPRVMMGRHFGHPQVHHVRGTKVRMEWQVPQSWHTEGEVSPRADAFDIEVRTASLRVLAP